MALDEFTVVLRARSFVRKTNPVDIPVSLDAYLKAAKAVLRQETDMALDEAGSCFRGGDGTHYISVNANDRPERQRFTVCHEIAHIVLGLQSDHKTQPWWSAKKPLAERLCDTFAAELILPAKLFQPVAEEVPVSFASVDALASRFLASVTATGSRYADAISTPCAFVLSEQGKIRYASRSKALQDANAWIAPQVNLPRSSVSVRTRAGGEGDREQIDADAWFSDWERGGVLLEEASHLSQWDQTLTLLWFESEEVPSLRRTRRDDRYGRDDCDTSDEEDELSPELDGYLRWPDKRRRR